MKALVICHKDLNLHHDGCKFIYQSQINGESFYYSLIDIDSPKFDSQKHRNAVLVQKKAFSCNYREQAFILKAYKKIESSNEIQYYSIGSEFSGIIVEIGDNVKNLVIGDKVIPNGEYPYTKNPNTRPGLPTNHASTEFEIIDCEKLVTIPDTMPYEVGAAFTIGAQTSYSMIKRLNIRSEMKILITGMTSNTSLFSLNALRNKGATICGIVRNTNHISQLNNLGVDKIFTINGDETSLLDVPEIMNFIISNGKFDIIIDPFADYYFLKVIDLMDIGGKYISCGISNQFFEEKVEINLNEIFGKIIVGNLSIIGNCLGSTENLKDAISDYTNNYLTVILDCIIENNIQSFFEESFTSKSRLGKVVFKY